MAHKMIEVFFSNPENVTDREKALSKERNLSRDEFDELMMDIADAFDVDIPMKPVKYGYCPEGINKSRFTIQQLSDYVENLIKNKQQ